MDLRKYIKSKSQIEKAKQLAIGGLLNYQPWIFSDDFETGVGMEWTDGEYAGLVYYPDIDQGFLERSPELRRLIINPKNFRKFHESNELLRKLYDGIVDAICAKVGDVKGVSFLDVGCNTGYFPQCFALRGARESAGCDREKNFSETFDLLNDILGTRAVFYDSFYNTKTREIVGIKQYDVVISMAVLCHLSEPLNHLKCLGALARRGLFVCTLVNNDKGYTVHYGETKGDYEEDNFPLCFDDKVSVSEGLLRRSLELMGFNRIYEVTANDSALPSFNWGEFGLRGFWGMR